MKRSLSILLLLLIALVAPDKYRVTIGGVTIEVAGDGLVIEKVTDDPVDPPPAPLPLPTPELFSVPENGTLAAACQSAVDNQVIRINGVVEVVELARIGRENGSGPKGVTIEFMPGARLVDVMDDVTPGPLLTINTPDCKVLGLDAVGNFGPRKCLKSNVAAHNLTVTIQEVKHFARHAIDVDGDNTLLDFPDDSNGIHHILWNDNGVRRDAHGIVTLHSNGLTIRNAKIYCCSGDCFQADRGVDWDNVTITGGKFWDEPLATDLGGFHAGDETMENVVDTKTGEPSESKTLTIENCECWGLRTKMIAWPAIFNIKEEVNCTITNCIMRDSTIGVRAVGVRSGTKRTNITVTGCRFENLDVAIRGEDKLENFTCTDNVLAGCGEYYVKPSGSQPYTYAGWSITGNTIYDASLVGKTFAIWSGDRDLLGLEPLAFPVPPLSWVDGALTRNNTNKIIAE